MESNKIPIKSLSNEAFNKLAEESKAMQKEPSVELKGVVKPKTDEIPISKNDFEDKVLKKLDEISGSLKYICSKLESN